MTDAVGRAEVMAGVTPDEVTPERSDSDQGDANAASRTWSWVAGDRAAVIAFALHLTIAWVLLVSRYGPKRWFLLEDWLMLAGRDGGSLGSIFAAHGEHPVALNVVVYRLLYNAFGLRYGPFVVAVVTLDVVLVVVVRVVLRHIGISAWTATIAAGVLVGLGVDGENSMPFQIGWIAALTLALLQLLAADHTGPPSRRDAFGVLLGVAAILAASVAALVIVTTGLVCLARRGWTPALAHTIPPVAAYQTWTLAAHPSPPDAATRPTVATSLDWAFDGIARPLDTLTPHPALAVMLAAVVAGGLWLSSVAAPTGWLRRHVVAMSMCSMSPILFFAVAQGRWRFGSAYVGGAHLVAIGLVFLMPAVATGLDVVTTLTRRPYALALLVMGVPAHTRWLDHPPLGLRVFEHERELIVAMAYDPRLDLLPSDFRLLSGALGPSTVTAGWLRGARDADAVPDQAADAPDPGLENELTIRMSLAQRLAPLSSTAGEEPCPEHDGPIELVLTHGDSIRLSGPVDVSTFDAAGPTSPLVGYSAPADQSLTLEVVGPELSVRIASGVTGLPLRACVLV